MNEYVKCFQIGEIYYFGKKNSSRKNKGKIPASCEVVPLGGQGSISIFFKKEMVLEKDRVVISEDTSSFREAEQHADGKIRFQF